MKLTDLKKGQKVTIRCKQKELLVDIDAYVVDVRAEQVFLQLIRHEGKIIDFSSPGVQLITIYEDGMGMPKAWVNCKIERRVIDGRQYHVLTTKKTSVKVNRRSKLRIRLDIPGRLNVTYVPNGIQGTIYDICENGIGVISPVKIEQQEELKHLQIQFANKDNNNQVIKVEAKVVWQKRQKNGYYYGCRLTHVNDRFNKFLAAKIEEKGFL